MKVPAVWFDHEGQRYRTPRNKHRLRCHQIPGHARLRDFVHHRDEHRCVRCTSMFNLVIDHIVSIRNGGHHHPSNLQTLCKTCNDKKSNYEDRGRQPP